MREANYSRGTPVVSSDKPYTAIAALVTLPLAFTKGKHVHCFLRVGTRCGAGRAKWAWNVLVRAVPCLF